MANEKKLSEPLAAYCLGLYAQTLWMWPRGYMAAPGDAIGLVNAIDGIASGMTQTRVGLLFSLHPNLYTELVEWIRCLNLQRHQFGPMLEELELEAQPTTPVVDLPALNLASLAEETATAHLPLQPWIALGTAVGAYFRALNALPCVGGDEDPLPAPDEIWHALEGLPHVTGGNTPMLAALRAASQAGGRRNNPRSWFAHVVVTAGGDITGYDVFLRGSGEEENPQGRSALEDTPKRGDEFVTFNLLADISHALITELNSLQIIPCSPPPTTPHLLVPSWDREHFQLRLGEQVIRTVRPVAKNCILVLDAFQEEDWPFCIDDPLPGIDPLRRHEVIRTLNAGLTRIRFFADGTNERIAWQFIEELQR